MSESVHEVTLEDFARSFGTTVEDIPEECRRLIRDTDFTYEILAGQKRDRVILDVLKKIDSDKQIIGAKERRGVWEKGWAENLQDFVKSDCDLDSLVPRFIRPNQTIRLDGNYVLPSNPNFELDYYNVYRLWLFKKYLPEFDPIYEFGCGTSFNLVTLARLFPEKKLFGLDFVLSSVELANKIGQTHKLNIKGRLFDMLSPDETLTIEKNSAIFTIGAIEQLASRFEPFLQFLLGQSPSLCLHVEPTIEFYDDNNLADYLAKKFHTKRGYTENYLTRLRELEAQKRIEIIKAKRPYFGSLFMEGYSYFVWRPFK